MGVVQESWQESVERMDVHLKAFFKDQQSWINHAFQGLEKRLGGRIDDLAARTSAVESRLDTLETNVKLGFGLMDARFTRIDRQLAEMRRDIKTLVKTARVRARRA